jgi:hypothetical protein
MENIRAYFSHLYFSLVVVLLGMIGLYIALSILDGVLSVVGMGFGFKRFYVSNYLKPLGVLWAVVSIGLACVLTYFTIKNRPVDRVVHTKRIQ